MSGRQILIMSAALLAAGALAHAGEEGPLEVVGFSRNSSQALFRRAGDPQPGPILLSRSGKEVSVQPRAWPALLKTHRHGTALRGEGDRLSARGTSLRLDAGGRRAQVGRGGQLVGVGKDAEKNCSYKGFGGAILSPDQNMVAAVLELSCEGPAAGTDHAGTTAETSASRPLMVYLPGLARAQIAAAASLARKGKHKEASAVLDLAAALAPGSLEVIYWRAQVAALAADQDEALRWLRALGGKDSAAARRLLVKAKFDDGFRLIRDSEGFKKLTELGPVGP